MSSYFTPYYPSKTKGIRQLRENSEMKLSAGTSIVCPTLRIDYKSYGNSVTACSGVVQTVQGYYEPEVNRTPVSYHVTGLCSLIVNLHNQI
jgi:hypothetical protein